MIFYQTRTSRRATCRGFPAFPFLVSLHIGPPAAVYWDFRDRCDIRGYTWQDFRDFCDRCHITASFLPWYTAIPVAGVSGVVKGISGKL